MLLIPFVTNPNKNRPVFPGCLVRGVRGATTRSLLATLYRRFPHESLAILRDYWAHYIVRSSLLDPLTLSVKVYFCRFQITLGVVLFICKLICLVK